MIFRITTICCQHVFSGPGGWEGGLLKVEWHSDARLTLLHCWDASLPTLNSSPWLYIALQPATLLLSELHCSLPSTVAFSSWPGWKRRAEASNPSTLNFTSHSASPNPQLLLLLPCEGKVLKKPPRHSPTNSCGSGHLKLQISRL